MGRCILMDVTQDRPGFSEIDLLVLRAGISCNAR